MLGSIVLLVFGVQAAGALLVSRARRALYWRFVGLVHLPFVACLVAGLLGALLRAWVPGDVVGYAVFGVVAAGFFAALVVSGVLVRRTAWTRAGLAWPLFAVANTFSAMLVMAMIGGLVTGAPLIGD
jgi:hypothetical protein